MTIRFVQQWNGYSPDTIVTLAGAEETRLIGLGYAVTDLDGPGNTPLPVTSTTNLTGGIEMRGPRGTIALPRLKQRPAVRIFDGRLNATHTIVHANGPGETFHAVFELAAAPDNVWVIYGNGAGSARQPTGTKVAVVTVADLNGASATWVSCTTGNPNIPASPGASRQGLVMTGVGAVANPTRSKLIAVRSFFNTASDIQLTCMGNGADGSGDNFTNWASRDKHRVLFRNQPGNSITTPTDFVSTTNVSYSPIIGVMYTSNERVYTCMCVGDSTESGRGTYLGSGPMYEALRVLGGCGLWEIANLSWAGSSTGVFHLNASDAITAGIVPDVLVRAIGSPNDVASSIPDSEVLNWRNYGAIASKLCADNGVYLVPRTMMPANSSIDTPSGSENYGADDAKRVAFNAETLGACSYALDYSGPVSANSANANGQVPFAAGMTTDSIHQNDTGIAAQASGIRARFPDIF